MTLGIVKQSADDLSTWLGTEAGFISGLCSYDSDHFPGAGEMVAEIRHDLWSDEHRDPMARAWTRLLLNREGREGETCQAQQQKGASPDRQTRGER